MPLRLTKSRMRVGENSVSQHLGAESHRFDPRKVPAIKICAVPAVEQQRNVSSRLCKMYALDSP